MSATYIGASLPVKAWIEFMTGAVPLDRDYHAVAWCQWIGETQRDGFQGQRLVLLQDD